MPRIISPSILAADFGNLKSACEIVNASKAEWVHIDVMDGVFVPNISFGFPVIEAIKKHCTRMLDVHLMIVHPEKYIHRFTESGAGMITFHYEATDNPLAVIEQIRAEGVKVGISINPDVPVRVLEPYLDKVDMVLLMTVFAGFGGQSFIEDSYKRIDDLRGMIQAKAAKCLIQVDGGVSMVNASRLISHGANVLVAGSAVFNSPNPIETIKELLNS